MKKNGAYTSVLGYITYCVEGQRECGLAPDLLLTVMRQAVAKNLAVVAWRSDSQAYHEGTSYRFSPPLLMMYDITRLRT